MTDLNLDWAESLANAKADLRKRILARRDVLPSHVKASAENAIRARVLSFVLARPGIVSGFLPIRSEVDIAPALGDLIKAGRTVVLPVVIDRTTLEFRQWDGSDALVDAGFGTRGPGPEAAVVDPQILLTPLAAFDRRGGRLGYGAGHYDRALARLDASESVIAVGVGFALQETEAVPTGETDRPLDAIITESETIICGAKR